MSDIVIISPSESANLSPTSSAFAHGFGLFETMRFADGQLLFWKDHWTRLSRSAAVFELSLPSEESVLAALRRLVEQAGLTEAILKLSLLQTESGSQLFVYSRPLLEAPAGRQLLLDASWPLSSRSLLSGHKTHNYMESMYLLNRARRAGYFDVVRLDEAGRLAETATSNLFFVIKGRICTPTLDTGILPGVVRSALCSADDLTVEVGHYDPAILETAESVFLTNATHGAVFMDQITDRDRTFERSLATSSELLEAVSSVLVRAEAERAHRLV